MRNYHTEKKLRAWARGFKPKRIAQISTLTLLLGPVSVFASSDGAGFFKTNDSQIATVFQQEDAVVLKGKVLDATQNNMGMVGANVTLKGTTVGTITDIDGNFTLKVPATGGTLIANFIGYETKEIPISGQTNITIILSNSTQNINEVVVTAMGISRQKKQLGYAISEMKGDDLKESNTISPIEAMQGKVAGVSIGQGDGGSFGGTKITIRGNNTFGDNNQPIYVVDGVILDNDNSGGDEYGGVDWGNEIQNLNPDDFASVTVLKGAAASALYGSRALNGAIVITTKGGTKSKGLNIDISESFSAKVPFGGPHFQNEYGVGQYAGFKDERADPFNTNQFYKDSQGRNSLEGQTLLSFGPKMEGQEVVDQAGNITHFDPQKHNFLDAFDIGFYNNTSIAISGGSDKTIWRGTYSFTKDKGFNKRNRFERHVIGSNVTHNVNDWLKGDLSVSYAWNHKINPPDNSVQSAFTTGGVTRDYDVKYWMKHYQADHGGVPGEYYGVTDPTQELKNSLGVWYSLFENNRTQNEQTLRLVGKITAKITPWLTGVLEANMNNFYTQMEYKEMGQGYNKTGGKYEYQHQNKYQRTFKGYFTFNKGFLGAEDEDLMVTVNAGGEMWQTHKDFTHTYTEGGLVVPGHFSMENSIDPIWSDAGIMDEKRLNSLYYLVSLGYKNQFFVDVTGRNDWASALTFSDQKSQNSYFYPSVSASWAFSETLKMPSWVDFGKLRLSYAVVGNDTSPYTINEKYTAETPINGFNGQLPNFRYTDVLIDPNIKPERQKSIETGFQLSMFNSKLGIDATYYKTNTRNQVIDVPIPNQTGMSKKKINAGNIQNQGLELKLDYSPVKSNDWGVDLSFIYTMNRNKVISIHPNISMQTLEGDASYGNRVASVAYAGGDFGALVSDAYPALDPKTGQPILRWDDDEKIAQMKRNNNPNTVVGSMEPKWEGSFSARVRYKNWSLSSLFDIRCGGDIVSYSNRYGTAYGNFESTLKGRDAEHGGKTFTASYNGNTYDDGMIPEGVFEADTKANGHDVGGMTFKEAMDKGFVDPVHASAWYYRNYEWGSGVIDNVSILKCSYIGIREMNLTYKFSKEFAQKLYMRNLSVSAFGRDLGYIYNSLPNHINPQSVRSNRAGAATEWSPNPYVMTLGMTVNISL